MSGEGIKEVCSGGFEGREIEARKSFQAHERAPGEQLGRGQEGGCWVSAP